MQWAWGLNFTTDCLFKFRQHAATGHILSIGIAWSFQSKAKQKPYEYSMLSFNCPMSIVHELHLIRKSVDWMWKSIKDSSILTN